MNVRMVSYAAGTHYPEVRFLQGSPYCAICLRRLTRYQYRGQTSYRHNWRDRGFTRVVP